jgi:hypothetical protein
MIDPNHLYTLHHMYTGAGCAHCGKEAEKHPAEFWMVNGEKIARVSATEATDATNV